MREFMLGKKLVAGGATLLIGSLLLTSSAVAPTASEGIGYGALSGRPLATPADAD